jgi:3',5'-cyclic AMP phosphodiesterase CpdA
MRINIRWICIAGGCFLFTLAGGGPLIYPPSKFIVLSDLHYYDPSLGTTGKALDSYLQQDRKLLVESSEILESAVDSIVNDTADFVLVCGDLTKDGELIDHYRAAQYLKKIEASGKKVYVIPGNHDLLNYEAYRYDGDKTESVAHIAPEDFRIIYNDFGYAEAVNRDTNSLSYVCEPVPGLWLLALDGCQYRRNKPGHESPVGGRLSEETERWLEDVLKKATAQQKSVIALIHHGVIEHFPGEGKYFGEYLISNRDRLVDYFMNYNVKFVFTGHFHAQDIVIKKNGDHNFLCDVETGSLVTYPSPYREVEITADQRIYIRTKHVTATRSHPIDFPKYEREYTQQGLEHIALGLLRRFRIRTYNAPFLAAYVADIFLANYAGDETPVDTLANLTNIGCLGGVMLAYSRDLLNGLTRDPEPPDNDLTIDLNDGRWQ